MNRNQMLPECIKSFEYITKTLDAIEERVTRLDKALLGNGSEGAIHELRRRTQVLELLQEQTDAKRKSQIKEAITQMPKWGWLILIAFGAAIGWDRFLEVLRLFGIGG